MVVANIRPVISKEELDVLVAVSNISSIAIMNASKQDQNIELGAVAL